MAQKKVNIKCESDSFFTAAMLVIFERQGFSERFVFVLLPIKRKTPRSTLKVCDGIELSTFARFDLNHQWRVFGGTVWRRFVSFFHRWLPNIPLGASQGLSRLLFRSKAAIGC